MGLIGLERTIELLKALLAGEDPKVNTPDEAKVKASLKADIETAESEGYQIEIPNE